MLRSLVDGEEDASCAATALLGYCDGLLLVLIFGEVPHGIAVVLHGFGDIGQDHLVLDM